MKYLIEKDFDQGMNELYGLPEKLVRSLSFGVATIKAGDRFGETLNRREAVLIIISGKIAIRGSGFDHGELETSADIFSEPPIAVYCPPGLYAAKAVEDTEMVIFRSDTPKDYKGTDSRVIRSAAMDENTTARGKVLYHTIRKPDDDVSKMTVGLTILQPGVEAALPSAYMNNQPANGYEGLHYYRAAEDGTIGEVKVSATAEHEGQTHEIHNHSGLVVPAGAVPKITTRNHPVACFWAIGEAD